MSLHLKPSLRVLVRVRQFYHSIGFYRVVFHLCATLVFAVALYNKNERALELKTILILSSIYLLLSVFVAINNLTLFKRYLLTENPSVMLASKSNVWSGISKGAVRYFLFIIFLAFGAAFLLDYISIVYLFEWINTFKTPIIVVAITYVGICLFTTGIIYIDKQRADIRGLIKKIKHNIKPNSVAEETQTEVMVSINHIKIGNKTKFSIIKLEDIIYIEADGKEPAIHSVDGIKYGNISINEYEKQLPKNDFIRVHRRYIIAKASVIRRDKKAFILSDNNNHIIKIPIGDSFLTAIENDTYLGFNTRSLKGDASPDTTEELPNTSQSATGN